CRAGGQTPVEIEYRRVEIGAVQPRHLCDPAKLQTMRTTLIREVQLQIMRFAGRIQVPPVVQLRIALHVELRQGLGLELRHERYRKAQLCRIETDRWGVLILAPASRSEQHIHDESGRRNIGCPDHYLVPWIHIAE